jgi:hypothetical protein
VKRPLSRGLLAAVLLVLVACSCSRRGSDWRILQLYSGETTVEVLAHPTKVQLSRLGDPAAAKREDVRAGAYPAAGPVLDLPQPAAAELSQILSDAASYEWQRTRSGPFAPQVGVWFVRGAYVLALALDVQSGRVSVHAGDQFLGTQALDDSARRRLLAVARAALPQDTVLAGTR